MQNSKEVIFCHCGCDEHQLIISHFDDYGDPPLIFLSVNLSDNLSLLKRIKLAVMYIFGYRSRYGMFAEILLDKKSAVKLVDSLSKIHGKS
jgi:hypothetical protein